jgi:hypothetical protein
MCLSATGTVIGDSRDKWRSEFGIFFAATHYEFSVPYFNVLRLHPSHCTIN